MGAMTQTCSLLLRSGPGLEFVIADREAPCWNCGASTRQIEICFGAFLCSEVCVRAKNDEYWAALRLSDFAEWCRRWPL
jgi:hypothetical protein